MARASTVFLFTAVVFAALCTCSHATVYDNNVKAFSVAIKKFPEYSMFAKYYVQYVNSSQVRASMQHPCLIFIPTNKALKANKALEKLTLSDLTKYVGFHAVLFPTGKAPLGSKGLINMKAGTVMRAQQGGVIMKVSAPGKTPVKLRGKKPVVVNVVNAKLFSSTTLNAMGIDGVMTPSNM